MTISHTTTGAKLYSIDCQATAALADWDGTPASETIGGDAYVALKGGRLTVLFNPHEMETGHATELTAQRDGVFWVTVFLDGELATRGDQAISVERHGAVRVKWDYSAMA